jgi:hypothetical protein
MEKFTVKFQNQNVIVWAKNHKLAMRQALKTQTKVPIVIAALSCVLKQGDSIDDELLFGHGYMKSNGYFDDIELSEIN